MHSTQKKKYEYEFINAEIEIFTRQNNNCFKHRDLYMRVSIEFIT